jgi:hypothetical protein
MRVPPAATAGSRHGSWAAARHGPRGAGSPRRRTRRPLAVTAPS